MSREQMGPPVQAEQGAPAPQSVTVSVQVFGPESMKMTCSQCKAQMITHTEDVAGCLTWTACILLILGMCWCGCCLIPFYIRDCKNIEHRCPQCRTYLGVYKRI